jgi:hypothetical protein
MSDIIYTNVLPFYLIEVHPGRYIAMNWNVTLMGSVNKKGSRLRGLRLGLTEDEVRQLSCTGSTDRQHIYLFNSDCAPWLGEQERVAFCKRIALLMEIIEARGFSSLGELAAE